MNNFTCEDPVKDAEAYDNACHASYNNYIKSLPKCCCCGEPIEDKKYIEIDGESWCNHCENVNVSMLWDTYARSWFLIKG